MYYTCSYLEGSHGLAEPEHYTFCYDVMICIELSRYPYKCTLHCAKYTFRVYLALYRNLKTAYAIIHYCEQRESLTHVCNV